MSNLLRNKGMMFIISSPSGAGKSTITCELLNKLNNIKISVSVTTRTRRAKEKDGIDYFFLTNEQFDKYIENNSFIEHAKVFGNRYGTLKSEVKKYIDAGIDVIFDVDWQGARKLKQQSFANCISIYILPPSLEALESRLRARNQDDNNVINKRMAEAKDEISHYKEYDYIVLNDNLEEAVKNTSSIIIAERNRASNLNTLDQAIKSI